MALALKFEQMIRQGVVSHYAILAAVGQVSRSRVTQIMNLLHLAPDIQEQVLFWKEPTAAPRNTSRLSPDGAGAETWFELSCEAWSTFMPPRAANSKSCFSASGTGRKSAPLKTR